MLRERVRTALVAGGLLLFFLWLGPAAIIGIWGGLGLWLVWEWGTGEKLSLAQRMWCLLFLLPIWGGFFFPLLWKAVILAFVGGVVVPALFLMDSAAFWRWIGQIVWAGIFLGSGWGAVIGMLLRESYSLSRTLAFLSFAWIADTSAYLVGRYFGRHPILPHISPNKTWEGFLAGLLATGIWGYWAVPWVGGFNELPPYLVGAGMGAVAFVGDAFQSAWKRVHGLKDTGHLLPGHGGLWDRVDSLLWIAPVWYFLG